MQKFKSHKIVEAAKVVGFEVNVPDEGATLWLTDGDVNQAQHVDNAWLDKNAPGWGTHVAEVELVGGYFVRYADGYTSWSPAEAFESGYTALTHDPKNGALPVSGYKPQTQEKVDVVNGFKADEERLLRKLDNMMADTTGFVDKRWAAIGRTQLEQAFMAINRSVFQPGRIRLVEDDVEGQYASAGFPS
ncbi:hypothetical protein JessAGP_016 [Caulobacter phage Jess A]|nr:hypothetical protein JessAGP_016 [Caulobacter phage Jess A]WCA46425.1 hypothetical protein [Caulobacter phage RapA]